MTCLAAGGRDKRRPAVGVAHSGRSDAGSSCVHRRRSGSPQPWLVSVALVGASLPRRPSRRVGRRHGVSGRPAWNGGVRWSLRLSRRRSMRTASAVELCTAPRGSPDLIVGRIGATGRDSTPHLHLGRVGKRILGGAPSGWGHGDSTGDLGRAVGGAGAVVPGAEGDRVGHRWTCARRWKESRGGSGPVRRGGMCRSGSGTGTRSISGSPTGPRTAPGRGCWPRCRARLPRGTRWRGRCRWTPRSPGCTSTARPCLGTRGAGGTTRIFGSGAPTPSRLTMRSAAPGAV